jgi:dihydroceramide fatty acyl 2-hydroxylase
MDTHTGPSTKRDEPIRIFKSSFLEFFSHISPVAVLVVWVPIIGFFIWLSIRDALGGLLSVWLIPVEIVAGMLMWSLTEYVLHRFLFHYHPKSEWGKRINFMFHGVHHAQPMIKTRLVMPPIISLPIGVIMYSFYALIFQLVFNVGFVINALFAGTAIGYLLYDMTHYATHHFQIKGGWFQWIRSHHMKHHVQTPDERFGVTSPLWDYAFGTEPKDRPTAKKTKA